MDPIKIKRRLKQGIPKSGNMENFYPRSIRMKTAQGNIPSVSTSFSGGDVQRGPTRRFYSPEIMLSSMFIPVERRAKNRWRRWFYEHDAVVGPVVDILAELPWSDAHITCPDPAIRKIYEDTVEETNFFDICQTAEREYLITGEAILHFYFDEKKGIWTFIVIHDPDYIEIESSPIINKEKRISIIPDEALRILTTSSDSYHMKARQKLPRHVLKSVLWGQNILLNNDRTVQMARLIRPGATRGSSIIDRCLRSLMYEDKMKEAQISIADNFVYPLRIFKLGNESMGIPPKEHADALADLLLQAQFDPNFSIIYHYGLQYEEYGHDGKMLRLENELKRVSEEKMLALGVNAEFLTGKTTFASANVYLTMLFNRMAMSRSRHERSWIYPKFFKTLAKIRGFKKRTQAELSHGIRVKKSYNEEDEYILPILNWHKSLTGREDREYLDFLSTRSDKKEISRSTLLSRAGIDFKKELENIKNDERLELQVGVQTEQKEPGPLAFFKTMRQKIASIFGNTEEEKIEENAYEWNKEIVNKNHLEVFKKKESNFNNFNLDELNRNLWQKSLNKIYKYPKLYDAYFSIDDYLDKTEENKKELIKNIYKIGRKFSYDQLSISFKENQITDNLLFEDFIRFPFSDDLIFRKACLDAFVLGQLISFNELGVEGIRLYYANEDSPLHLNRYKTSSLLSKNFELSNLLYPNFEIIYLYPEISSFGSNFYPFEKRINMEINNIKIENLPIEYQSFFDKDNFKLKNINKISFLNKLQDSEEWLQSRVEHYRDLKIDENLIGSLVIQDANSQKASITKKKHLILPTSIFKQNGHPLKIIDKYVAEIKK